MTVQDSTKNTSVSATEPVTENRTETVTDTEEYTEINNFIISRDKKILVLYLLQAQFHLPVQQWVLVNNILLNQSSAKAEHIHGLLLTA